MFIEPLHEPKMAEEDEEAAVLIDKNYIYVYNYNLKCCCQIYPQVHLPEATISVFVNVAMALIQFASLFSDDTPCANGFVHNGFFFMALHTHNELINKK